MKDGFVHSNCTHIILYVIGTLQLPSLILTLSLCVGPIFDMTYEAGFLVTNAKMTRLSRNAAEEFYAEHVGKPFYE